MREASYLSISLKRQALSDTSIPSERQTSSVASAFGTQTLSIISQQSVGHPTVTFQVKMSFLNNFLIKK